MLSRALLLILGVLLLPSLDQGGLLQKRKPYAVKRGHSVIRECVRKPKLYLCNHRCEADQDCQANNICCSTLCGNVCVNLLNMREWAVPINPADNFFPEIPPSGFSFEGDMVIVTFTPPPAALIALPK